MITYEDHLSGLGDVLVDSGGRSQTVFGFVFTDPDRTNFLKQELMH